MLRSNRIFSRTGGRARPDRTTITDPVACERALQESQEALAVLRKDAPEYWPQSRQLALMFIHRSDNALAIIAKLSGTNVRPRQHDFAALRNNGYAKKELGERYHRLTPEGRRVAKKVAFALGNSLGMHLPEFIFNSWTEHRARCCCGWSASVNRRANARAAERLGREFEAHKADPDAWKLAGEAGRKVIADLFPPRPPVAREDCDAIDDAHNVYGDGWPEIKDLCNQSPNGQHAYDAINNPEICLHCKRRP